MQVVVRGWATGPAGSKPPEDSNDLKGARATETKKVRGSLQVVRKRAPRALCQTTHLLDTT